MEIRVSLVNYGVSLLIVENKTSTPHLAPNKEEFMFVGIKTLEQAWEALNKPDNKPSVETV